MKTWENAEVMEINFAETEYGARTAIKMDDVWVNDAGEYESTWS